MHTESWRAPQTVLPDWSSRLLGSLHLRNDFFMVSFVDHFLVFCMKQTLRSSSEEYRLWNPSL